MDTVSSIGSLTGELRDVVGERNVIVDPDVRASYERDWTGRFGAQALAAVRPASTAEVAGVLRVASHHRVAVVPQGGNTGLVGGGVPRGGELVLSTARLAGLEAVDEALGCVEAGAGVTLARLQDHAAAAGLDAALDFGARDTATIGGIVACDAGGPRALRYGTARSRAIGIEAVLADGSVISRLGHMSKDNAGTNLPGLLIGCEGTLGVITRVLWKLEPRRSGRLTALVALDDVVALTRLMTALRRHAPAVEACELMTAATLDLVLEHRCRDRPVEAAPLYALVELAGDGDLLEQLSEAFAAAGVETAAIADDGASRARLWQLRDGATEAVNAHAVPIKLDVGVPLGSLAEFLGRVPAAVKAVAPRARVIIYGHVGDGNVHVNVLGADPDDHGVDDAVLGLALALGGTVSAEHGIGVAKRKWLVRARGEDDVAAMLAVKRALDPHAILNPGVVL